MNLRIEKKISFLKIFEIYAKKIFFDVKKQLENTECFIFVRLTFLQFIFYKAWCFKLFKIQFINSIYILSFWTLRKHIKKSHLKFLRNKEQSIKLEKRP